MDNSIYGAAIKQVLIHEGGYVNDRADRGGETYKGVSRRFHPGWPGWGLVDQAKSGPDFPANLAGDTALADMVAGFYRVQYWDRFGGDQLPPHLSAVLLDTAVNVGVHRAVGWLQEALNLLNRNQQDYQDLTVDGVAGPVTARVVANFMDRDHLEVLLLVFRLLQGNHYLDFMRRSPDQERFARGWLRRLAVTVGQTL